MKKTKTHYLYYFAGIGAFLILFRIYFGSSGLSLFVKPVTEDLGYTRAAFSIYSSLIPLVGMLLYPFIGKLIKTKGARIFVLLGGIWCSVGFALLAFCKSLPMFYLVGAFIGVMMFGSTSLCAPIIVNTWFVKGRGTVLGIVMAAPGLAGMILSPNISSFIDQYGWRNGYLLMAALMFILTLPTALIFLRKDPQSVGLEPYGLEAAAEGGAGPGSAAKELPGVDFKTASKTKQFYLCFISILILAIMAGVSQHLAAMMGDNGLDAVNIGLCVSAMSFGNLVARILMGYMNDSLGLKRTMIIIYSLAAVGMVALPLSQGLTVSMISCVFCSLSGGAVGVLPPLVVGKVFGQKDFAQLWSTINMAGPLGTALAGPIWGLVFDLTGSYKAIMFSAPIFLAIVCIVSILCLRPDERLKY